jgi:hypothetical protein
MADNFNINTTQSQSLLGGGIDPSTGEYLANSLYSNLLRQQQQEEAIKQAQQTVQANALSNSQKQAAANLGVNPNTANMVPIDAAVAEVKASADRQGLLTASLGQEIDAWGQALRDAGQQMVSQVQVDAQISKYQPKASTTKAGQSATFTADQDIAIPAGKKAEDLGLVADDTNPAVGHVPDDGQYQVLYDNDGNLVKFIPGGKTPKDQTDVTAAANAKEDQKERTLMNKILDQGQPSQRTPEGQATMKIQSGLAAMVLINQMQGNLTPNQMRELATSVANLLSRGGVVAEGQIDSLVPNTLFGKIKDWQQWLTNEPTGTGQQAFVKNLGDTVNREIGLSQQYLQQLYSSRLSQFSQFKSDKPDEYNADLTAHNIDPLTLEFKPPYHNMLTNAGNMDVNNSTGLSTSTSNPIVPGATPPAPKNDPLGIR